MSSDWLKILLAQWVVSTAGWRALDCGLKGCVEGSRGYGVHLSDRREKPAKRRRENSEEKK